ncbi:ataxin-7-like protein 3 [Penaeus vannamei]|uniref:ataxin-7-like protein 3 n=1 Tax=Penaeus vannamei TaxID=6689 RepID=UPI000F6760FF|nr:ataxin-7-like protein 3 [Penaeus vannamei]XP_027223113.1 ataxin-7-like protein 3 [Penaeus vannamei]XP_047489517.1 ataxin-7-like protein 3 [Penaeus chinensis]
MTKPSHREQVSNTGSWMVQAGGGGGGGRVGVDNNVLLSSLASPEALEAAAQSVSQELLDDAILNVVFEVHQSVKTGLMMLEVGSVEEEQKFLQVNAEGLDVFGQAPIKKQHECICPNCSRNLAASRFAPHLEKCMGMGRNSSRIASRRIQNSTKENSNSHHGGSDDDDDDDWMIDRKRKRRDKNSPRRSKNAKVKGDSVSSSSNVETTLATGTTEEKRAMLKQICGVVSEHTRKMCTRSIRCPQHTSEQRRAVRDQVFNGSGSETTTTTRAADSTSRSLGDTAEDIHVDIDGLDDGQLASSWDNDHSNTTSPADSTSTNNSTSSLAKRNGSKSKKKSSKSSKSSSSSHGSLLD